MANFKFSSFIGSASISVLTTLSFHPGINAEESDVDIVCPVNPTQLFESGGFCTLTPEKYGVRIYEMGLCTSNPISSNQFSRDSCSTTLSNNTPVLTDMASGKSFDLKSENPVEQPKAGKYSYAYIIIDPEFQLQFTYKYNNTTYYSNGKNSSASSQVKNATTVPPAKPFIETLDDFGDDEEGFSATANAPVEGGSITALLTDSNLIRSTSAAGTQRLVGVFTPSKPIEIMKDSKGLEVQFIVTDTAGGVEDCSTEEDYDDYFDMIDQDPSQSFERTGNRPDKSDQLCYFGSGPFSAKFRSF